MLEKMDMTGVCIKGRYVVIYCVLEACRWMSPNEKQRRAAMMHGTSSFQPGLSLAMDGFQQRRLRLCVVSWAVAPAKI